LTGVAGTGTDWHGSGSVGNTSVTVGVLLDPVLVDDEDAVVLVVVAFAATVVLGELPFLSLPQLATASPTQHTAATIIEKRTVTMAPSLCRPWLRCVRTVPSFHPRRD
jgi:hypothetical protein